MNLTDKYPGGEYIQNARRGTTDDPIRVRFEDARVTTCLTMAAQPGTVVTTGDGVGVSVDDRVPMVIIGRNGQNPHFAAVLEPVRAGDSPRVTGIRLSETADARIIAVELAGRSDTFKIGPKNAFSADLSAGP